MLQKYITTLVILIMGLSAHAQSTYFNVTETEPFKDSRRGSSLEGAFTLASGEIVAVRAAKKERLIRQVKYPTLMVYVALKKQK